MATTIIPDDDGELVLQRNLSDVLDGISKDQAAGFARVEKAIESKADRKDLQHIEARLDSHAQSIGELQTWRHDSEITTKVNEEHHKGTWTRRQKIGAAIGTVGIVLSSTFGGWIGIHL